MIEVDGIKWVLVSGTSQSCIVYSARPFGWIQVRYTGGPAAWEVLNAGRRIDQGNVSKEAAMRVAIPTLRELGTKRIVDAEEKLHDAIEEADSIGAPMP